MTLQNFDATRLLHRRLATTIAIYTTLFVVWIENVKAFVSQQQVAILVSDFLQKSSIAASNVRFPRSFSIPTISTDFRKFKSILSMNSFHHVGSSLFFSQTAAADAANDSNSISRSNVAPLRMASYIGDFGTDKPVSQTSSFKPFQSWYNVMDPTLKGPVYNDFSVEYSFTSPQHEWPSFFESDSSKDDDFYIEVDEDDEEDDVIFPHQINKESFLPVRALTRIVPWAFRSRNRSH